ncbi:MAG: Pesticidal crystal protein cry22Aa [Candidatus Hydrogenedentes bacterium ADurb.Bin101]|nr:MAG: Pesticidal crystal protein cry22Aa [Candidatus Hydrogenedentes bacterium ADurb.Bin101]
MKPSVTSLSVFLCVIAAAMFITATAEAQIRYVDKSATGANNGSSWANAYTTIQPAIDAMFAAGGGQVWVAGAPGGLVYNEARTELWGGPTAYAGSLVMKDNVAVFGGFEGWRGGTGLQETALSQRAPGVNVTVINGATSRAGSPAYHVVVFGKGAAPTVGSRLDGFQITGGNAAGVSGVYHAYRGGGIYNWRSNPVIANCRIYGNTASVSGGGVANEGISGDAAAAQYINCVIDGNTATRNIDWQSNPARGGGGMFINLSTPTVTQCTITANSVGAGAAVPGNPNHGLNSGGMFNVAVNPLPATAGTVLSCISYGNTGGTPVGIENAAITGAVKALTCTYSDIQGGYAGTGNINAVPNFSGAAPFPYQITGAPCLNTGSSAITEDIRLVPRPIGGARDMGAYEYSANGPSAVCAAYTMNLDASCTGTMTAANIDGGSTAEAGIYKRIASQTTFGSADIPSKTVTLTITDRIGRTATCNATVTVNDPIAPVITSCPGNQTLNANAVCVAPAPNLAALVTATDNCGIASITQVPAAGTNLPLGPTPIQITVTDVGGNAVLTCAPVVTVVDVTPPVISVCPTPQSVAGDANCQAVMPNFLPTGTYVDNCAVASVTQNPTAGTLVTGTQTVTITVTDTAGLTAQCQTTLNINDTTNPVAVCQNITVNLSSPTVAATAIDGGSTDNCGITQRLIDGAASRTFTCANIPSAPAVLTVRDGNGNAASCTATVTVVDDVAPVAVCQNITVLLTAPTIGAAAIDGGSTDNCGITNMLIDGAPNKTFTCANLGPNTVTLAVSDAAGNTTTCNATVTVVDDINPTAVCQNITVNLSAPTVAAAAIDGGSTDNCGTIAGLLINGAASHTFTCTDIPSTVATLTVSDPTGNSVTCPATVTVVDDIIPVISLNGTSPVTVECGATYTDAGATANDNCDGPLVPGAVSTVNTAVVGPYTVTYTVSDAAGNAAVPVVRQVNVVDTTPPVITRNGSATVTVECPNSYTDAGATASDICSGSLTGEIVTVNPVDTSVPDSYTVTYNVSDDEGNPAAQVTRTVNVVDTTVPVISLLGNATVTVECGTSYTDDGATASDTCAGDLTSAINAVSTVNVNLVGSYTVTYTVSDGNGNDAVPVVRTVNVEDTIIPVITRTGQEFIYVPLFDTYTDAGATALDQCDGNITGDIVTVNPVDTNTPGFYTITYNVTDGEGNAAVERQRYVIVSDTLQPDVVSVDVETELTVLVTYNKDMTGGTGMEDPNNYSVSGSGLGTFSLNPDSVETVSGTVYRLVWVRPDEMFNGGDITITVDANVEDSAGNFMRIQVGTDSGGAIGEAPVITLNAGDEVLECGVDTFTEAGASAEDNVDGTVSVTITGDDLVDTAVPDAYLIDYDAVDAAGNASSDSRTVTVADTADPEIELVGAAALQLECNLENYEEYGASAWDACAGDLTSEIVTGAPANTGVLGLQIVTYSVTDTEGNSASVEREVTVVDTTAPSIALLGDNPVLLTDGSDYVEAGAEAFDECEGDLTDDIVIDGSVANTNEVATYVLTYTVSDSSANAIATARTVVVKPEDCELAYGLSVDVNPVTPGGTSTFTAAPLPENCSAGELHYIWTKNGEVIPDAPDAAIYVIESAEFTDTGTYKCSVSDASSSVDTNEVALIVTSGVPVAGAFGLLLAAAASALAGVASLRKRR